MIASESPRGRQQHYMQRPPVIQQVQPLPAPQLQQFQYQQDRQQQHQFHQQQLQARQQLQQSQQSHTSLSGTAVSSTPLADSTKSRSSPRSSSPGPDVKLSDFEVLDGTGGRSLGKGSFGVVRRIRRKGTDIVYALKTMQKLEVINGQLIDQVEREIQFQKQMKHENVLRLYKHFEDADTVYLLLEYCAKGELYQLLRTQRGRRFTEAKTRHFFKHLVCGLRYLHSHNIVHRDLKPENLLVTHDDVLKIGDFGWCASTEVPRTTFCGTMDYLAPEMIRGSGHDHNLDIWTVGILLYEMMVGRPPFQSTNHTVLVDRILNIAITFPASLPAGVVDLVQKLLQQDPQKRLPLEQVLVHPWVLEQPGDCKTNGDAPEQMSEKHTPQSEAQIQPQQSSQLPAHASSQQQIRQQQQPHLPQSQSQLSRQPKHSQQGQVPLQQSGRATSCDQVRTLTSPRPSTSEDVEARVPVSSASANSVQGASANAPAAQAQPASAATSATSPTMTNRTAPRKSPWSSQSSQTPGFVQQGPRPVPSPAQTPVLTRRGVCAPVQHNTANNLAATYANKGMAAVQGNWATPCGGLGSSGRQRGPSQSECTASRNGRPSSRLESPNGRFAANGRAPTTATSVPPPNHRNGRAAGDFGGMASVKSASAVSSSQGSQQLLSGTSTSQARPRSGAGPSVVVRTGPMQSQPGLRQAGRMPASQPASPNLGGPSAARSLSPVGPYGRTAGMTTAQTLASAIRPGAPGMAMAYR